MKRNQRKKHSLKEVAGQLLFVTLLLSIGFSAYKIAVTPAVAGITAAGERLRSDYVLMLVQCLLGLPVMFLPALLEHRFSIRLPNYMCVMYFVFLYCAIYLGEVRNFYYVIPYWDTLLHAFSAMMLGALGFALVSILNDSPRAHVELSPLFVGLFAFCFAVMVGVLWEAYEFAADGLLGMNMQKFRLENGTVLAGRAALMDTMEDLLTDMGGALLVAVVGSLTIKKKIREDVAR